jgi:hypothetical protein
VLDFSVVKKVIALVIAVFVALVAWTVYANVLSSDLEVRATAELAARAKAGCGEKCSLARMEGSRGAFAETLDFTFRNAGTIHVTCRRPYIAFGAYACEAAKP